VQLEGAEVYYRKMNIRSLEPGTDASTEKSSSQLDAMRRDNPPAAESAAFEPPPMDVPDGFEVTVAEHAPLVEHPMMACFWMIAAGSLS